MNARDLAILFHETYERLAPSFGYETRQETRQFDEDSHNGRLMIAVCTEILAALDDPYMPTLAEWVAHPWARWTATDYDGVMWFYALRPRGMTRHYWVDGGDMVVAKKVYPPADFRSTLRQRPEGI